MAFRLYNNYENYNNNIKNKKYIRTKNKYKLTCKNAFFVNSCNIKAEINTKSQTMQREKESFHVVVNE